jgi:hypothetical protein
MLQLCGAVMASEILSVPTLFMLQLLDHNLIVSLPDILIPPRLDCCCWGGIFPSTWLHHNKNKQSRKAGGCTHFFVVVWVDAVAQADFYRYCVFQLLLLHNHPKI